MQVKDIMTTNVITIDRKESAAVAARRLEHYNIGALPVCTSCGQLCGMVTDRDLALRCLAAGRMEASVAEVMSRHLTITTPEAAIESAAALMAANQIRRLPVLEGGKLCGMLSLSDIAEQTEAGETLRKISRGIR